MTIFTAFSKEVDVTTEAGYAIAWNIARCKRPYTDGEFMKEMKLRNDLASPAAFSMAFDEFTDIEDNPLPAVFVRYVSKHFCVKEELPDLVALMDTTKGVDIKNAVDSVLSESIPP